MTIQELQDQLARYDPALPVCIDVPGWPYIEILAIDRTNIEPPLPHANAKPTVVITTTTCPPGEELI